MKKLGYITAAAVILAACSSEPMITDYDVLVHQNRGELHQLYDRLNRELKEASSSSDVAENRRIYIERVGRRIADDKERQLLNRLDRDLDKHDIATLKAEQERAAEIEQYNREVYLDINGQLQRSIDTKLAEIREKENTFDGLGDEQAPQKVVILEDIAKIYGGREAEQTYERRTQYIAGLYQQAEQALESRRHEQVRMHLQNLRKIAPDFEGLDELHHRLIAADHEQDFWDALSRGNTAKAYDTYRELTRIPDYLEQNPDVVPVAKQLADLFIAEGNTRMDNYAVVAAFQAFTRARYIKNTLGQEEHYTEGEQKFIEFVDRRLKGYIDDGETVPAYAFLKVMENLQPEHETVQEYAQRINNQMLDHATIKIIPSAFSDIERRALGSSIVSMVQQALLENTDIRVQVIDSNVDGERLTRSMINEMPNAASYYFLSGEILDASVDQQETRESTTKKVLTSYQRVENPEYIAWSNLSRRDKRNTVEPESTIEIPVEEEVTLNKTIVEKRGVLSVTYRMTEAASSDVLFADSITMEERVSDESIDGVRRGLFEQQAKQADLPADGQILEKLSKQLAEGIADRIAEQVANLESRYHEQGDRAVVNENFNVAIANYAYANVLLQAAGEQDQELLEKLRGYAIRWSN